MTASFHFETSLDFTPASDQVLRDIPARPGVFALYGRRPEDEPYLTRAADLRRRIVRLLAPPESQSRRLNLRDRVVRIAYCVTGSEFESSLLLYHAVSAQFGYAEARRRLRLNTPYFLRLTTENAFPRVYSTNKLSKRALTQSYGPFPSRAAAERYCDAVLDLFKIRRCYEDLAPFPEHPGCAYGEMKMCLAPCNQTCTPQQYAEEAAAVQAFFDTHGESMLATIAASREQASADMDFERAAAEHAHWQKVKAVTALADQIVRPAQRLRALIVQPGAKEADAEGSLGEAALFLLQGGCVVGPRRLSILGVRAVKEQTSVGSSLFAQPLMLQAIPLENNLVSSNEAGTKIGAVTKTGAGAPCLASETWVSAESPTLNPELRAANLITTLEQQASEAVDVASISDQLSLVRRWYYRPEKQRTGEIFFPNPDGSWPIRSILRGAARMVLGEPGVMADTQREAAKTAKVRILHEGRPDVERLVPVVDKPPRKPRTAKAAPPATPQ